MNSMTDLGEKEWWLRSDLTIKWERLEEESDEDTHVECGSSDSNAYDVLLRQMRQHRLQRRLIEQVVYERV